MNGLILPNSASAVKANSNRIKTLKRSLYGRAGFALLCARLLLALMSGMCVGRPPKVSSLMKRVSTWSVVF
jgi:hypothetical protein